MTSDRGSGEAPERSRVGRTVAAIPVALFLLSAAFIALRPPSERPGACRHDHPVERVREWWEKARANEVSVPGTRYVALGDTATGGAVCIRAGLEDDRARPHLERRFRRLGVPREVVVYEPVDGGRRGSR